MLLAISGVATLSALYEVVEWLTAAVVDPAAGTAYHDTASMAGWMASGRAMAT